MDAHIRIFARGARTSAFEISRLCTTRFALAAMLRIDIEIGDGCVRLIEVKATYLSITASNKAGFVLDDRPSRVFVSLSGPDLSARCSYQTGLNHDSVVCVLQGANLLLNSVEPLVLCYALLRIRPLSMSCAECSVVISCGKVDYDKSG
jgi:hypothetical protein